MSTWYESVILPYEYMIWIKDLLPRYPIYYVSDTEISGRQFGSCQKIVSTTTHN